MGTAGLMESMADDLGEKNDLAAKRPKPNPQYTRE